MKIFYATLLINLSMLGMTLSQTAALVEKTSEPEYFLGSTNKIIRVPVPGVFEIDLGGMRYLVCEKTKVIISKCPLAQRPDKS